MQHRGENIRDVDRMAEDSGVGRLSGAQTENKQRDEEFGDRP